MLTHIIIFTLTLRMNRLLLIIINLIIAGLLHFFNRSYFYVPSTIKKKKTLENLKIWKIVQKSNTYFESSNFPLNTRKRFLLSQYACFIFWISSPNGWENLTGIYSIWKFKKIIEISKNNWKNIDNINNLLTWSSNSTNKDLNGSAVANLLFTKLNLFISYFPIINSPKPLYGLVLNFLIEDIFRKIDGKNKHVFLSLNRWKEWNAVGTHDDYIVVKTLPHRCGVIQLPSFRI